MSNVSAYQSILHICEEYGEFLPLDIVGDDLFLYNVTNVINAFNIDKSIVTRGQRTGVITSFKTFVFHPDIIGDNHIFKIPEDRQTIIFVTDTFKDKIDNIGLTGFQFRLLWSE